VSLNDGAKEVENSEECGLCALCMVCLPPVLSLQLHRYPKCIVKGRTPGGGVNAIDGLSCSTVVFLLNELFVTAHVDNILNTDSNK